MSGVFGDLFEHVVVVNLARRPDRLAAVTEQLERLGVGFERFEAVDGRSPPVAAAWQRYMRQPLAKPPAEGAVTSYREFYLGDRSDRARLAFVETRDGKKAIHSVGAWGLLLSMTGVLERAIARGWESVLILEDDVSFHRDTVELLPAALAELPEDWLIFQLGAMQLHWEDDWISWPSERLYRCNGSSIGAHAVGLKREVFGELLEACRRCDLPYDIGALQTIKRRHRARCFTCYPNVAIQDPRDSEIGMSKIFFEAAKMQDNIYRWKWLDYGLSVLRAWRAGPPPEKAVESAPPAELAADEAEPAEPPRPEAPQRRILGPLQPNVTTHPEATRLIVLLCGLTPEEAAPYIELLARQTERGEAAPIAVVDDARLLDALRRRKIPLEHLPTRASYARFGEAVDGEIYRLRRLWLMRRKWRPARVLAFGEPAKALLEDWRASPFEQRWPNDDLSADAAEPAAIGETQ